MVKYLQYWWDPHSQPNTSDSEKYFTVHYDEHGRNVLIEEYGSDHKLIASARLNWGKWDQVKIQKDDRRPISTYRRWLWKVIERFFVQHSFRRSLWQKVISALFKPDFLIRVDNLAANGALQEYFLYVYFPDNCLACIEQYLADGTFVQFVPVE
jgi:hypothetical protein